MIFHFKRYIFFSAFIFFIFNSFSMLNIPNNLKFDLYTREIETMRLYLQNLSTQEKKNDALIYAVDGGWPGPVKYLLEHGADVNVKNRFGRTLLMSAVLKGKIDIVKTLIKKRIDINVKIPDGCTAINFAIFALKSDIFHYLVKLKDIDLNSKDSAGESVLHWAIKAKSIEFVKELIFNGAEINVKNKKEVSPIISAALAGRPDIFGFLVSCGADISDLYDYSGVDYYLYLAHNISNAFYAVKSGKLYKFCYLKNCLKTLMDYDGNSLLHHAVLKNNKIAVILILSIKPGLISFKNLENKTPLDLAFFKYANGEDKNNIFKSLLNLAHAK